MPFGSNPSCPPGQTYSMLLQKCIADSTGTYNDVPVNQSDGSAPGGGFFSGANIVSYSEAFANIWNSIKGTNSPDTVIIQQEQAQNQQKNNTLIFWFIGVVLLILLMVLLLRKKK